MVVLLRHYSPESLLVRTLSTELSSGGHMYIVYPLCVALGPTATSEDSLGEVSRKVSRRYCGV